MGNNDVIGHVSIRFLIGHFLLVVLMAPSLSPAVFEILRFGVRLMTKDNDLSGSRDIIGHVTIRFPIGHFLVASSGSFSAKRVV